MVVQFYNCTSAKRMNTDAKRTMNNAEDYWAENSICSKTKIMTVIII